MNDSLVSRTFEKLARASIGFALLMPACGGGGTELSNEAVPSDFETLTMVVYAGYVSGSPPGSSCEMATYPETRTVDSASRRLTWDYCGGLQGAPLDELQQGERSLTDDEYASILEALEAVNPSRAMSCGADASVVTLDLVTEAGTKRYANDFYSGCPWEVHQGRTFVEGLGSLSVVLGEL